MKIKHLIFFYKYKNVLYSLISTSLFIWYIFSIWSVYLRFNESNIKLISIKNKLEKIKIVTSYYNELLNIKKSHFNTDSSISKKVYKTNYKDLKIDSDTLDGKSIEFETQKNISLFKSLEISPKDSLVLNIDDVKIKKTDTEIDTLLNSNINETTNDNDKIIKNTKSKSGILMAVLQNNPQKNKKIKKNETRHSSFTFYLIPSKYASFFFDSLISKKRILLGLFKIDRTFFTTTIDLNSKKNKPYKCLNYQDYVYYKLSLDVSTPYTQSVIVKTYQNFDDHYFFVDKSIIEVLDDIDSYLKNSNDLRHSEFKKEFYPFFNDVKSLSLINCNF